MKKQTFNDLLIRFNKYRNKLVRLQKNGKNEHRQGVLQKHIERLFTKLQNLELNIKRKAVLAASCAAVMSLGVQNVNAQFDFEGDLHVNPFSLTPTNAYRTTPTFVDLDNDGDLDILTGSDNGTCHYYENAGTASAPVYAAIQTNPFSLSSVRDPEFVDLDGDGDLDLLSGTSGGDWSYFENIGTASAPNFAAAQTNPFALTNEGQRSSPSFVDFDNDGDFDMLGGEYGGNFNYFENIGNATSPNFTTVQINPFSLTPSYQTSPEIMDLDGDGDFDVIASSGYGGFFYYENTGSSSSPSFAPVQIDPFSLRDNSTGYDNGIHYAVSDLDNDGDFDLVSGSLYYGNLFYFENVGNSSVPEYTDNYSDFFSLPDIGLQAKPTLFDLDNDGDLDIMAGMQSGDFNYFENIGTASVPDYDVQIWNHFSLTATPWDNSAPTFVDLDGDGDHDLMAGTQDGRFYYYENTGTVAAPNFTAYVQNPYSLVDIGNNSKPTFVDLDNDGDLDLMATETFGSNSIYNYFENIGTSTAPSFGTEQIAPFSLPGVVDGNTAPIFVDMDGDGDMDLLAGAGTTGNHAFLYFENTGTISSPSFAVPSMNPYSLPSMGHGNAPALGDLDGDNDLDMIVGQEDGHFMFIENLWPCLVNTNVSQSGITLTADQTGATYQWVDCDNSNTAVVGETNQSFTPTANGNYACEIDLTACNDITACTVITTVGVNESNIKTMNIAPNPAKDLLNISTLETVEQVTIYSISGSLVKNINQNINQINVEDLTEGVYILVIKTENGITRNRFIKE
jgi:hypothetical protein